MSQRITVVDAFTEKPFAGNPAAVCILEERREDIWMQRVAAEMNLSETAFLQKRDDGWSLRWFTPVREVDLCGHATLASSHVLWEEGHLGPEEQGRFHTLSGLLTARRRGPWIELDFPATPVSPAPDVEGIEAAIGVRPVSVGKSKFDLLMELETEETVRKLKPDMTRLGELPFRGYIVTARARSSSPGCDFVSRFFAPTFGVPEDPVTGSAHCALAPYWKERLRKDRMVGFQCSRRGGTVRVEIRGDRVLLGGMAVTALRGELFS